MRLAQLVDVEMIRRLAEANYRANGMPIAVVDAEGDALLVGVGFQDICRLFHRVHPVTAARCRESDAHIKRHMSVAGPCEYTCRNGLRDIGIPILVDGQHLATLFLGQFFYEGESPDRRFFAEQAREIGFDETAYLAALDRVPVFPRPAVENILAYDEALAAFIADLCAAAIRRQRLEHELRATNRAKDEFLGMLSHELRNPLAPIRNALYILDHTDPAGPQARRAKDVANRQLAHLTRIVDDLLDVTRIARGKIELRREILDVADLARRTGEDHRSVMRERGLELEVELPPGPVWVDGDPTRLAQCIGNLLQNATKFTPERGRVTLALAAVDDAVEIRVRDTGAGMDPELLGHVFEPFVQAYQPLARTAGGLGLGLALVKGLVERHGGTVRAASAGAGKGSELAIRLPLAPADRRPGSPPAVQDLAPVRVRVLVVDDLRDAAESLAELVRVHGHEAEVTFDGESAIEAVAASPPDLVLCDIGLPGVSGYQVARTLRADRRFDGVRLVAVSGYARPEDRQHALDAGFSDHLAKPVDPERILRLLSAVKASRR